MERYSEVRKIMSNAEHISIYTEFRMAASYHDITQRQALDEAIKLWLDQYNWERKRPRFFEDKETRDKENKEAAQWPKQR